MGDQDVEIEGRSIRCGCPPRTFTSPLEKVTIRPCPPSEEARPADRHKKFERRHTIGPTMYASSQNASTSDLSELSDNSKIRSRPVARRRSLDEGILRYAAEAMPAPPGSHLPDLRERPSTSPANIKRNAPNMVKKEGSHYRFFFQR